jgi:hypothetical protein
VWPLDAALALALACPGLHRPPVHLGQKTVSVKRQQNTGTAWRENCSVEIIAHSTAFAPLVMPCSFVLLYEDLSFPFPSLFSALIVSLRFCNGDKADDPGTQTPQTSEQQKHTYLTVRAVWMETGRNHSTAPLFKGLYGIIKAVSRYEYSSNCSYRTCSHTLGRRVAAFKLPKKAVPIRLSFPFCFSLSLSPSLSSPTVLRLVSR